MEPLQTFFHLKREGKRCQRNHPRRSIPARESCVSRHGAASSSSRHRRITGRRSSARPASSADPVAASSPNSGRRKGGSHADLAHAPHRCGVLAALATAASLRCGSAARADPDPTAETRRHDLSLPAAETARSPASTGDSLACALPNDAHGPVRNRCFVRAFFFVFAPLY